MSAEVWTFFVVGGLIGMLVKIGLDLINARRRRYRERRMREAAMKALAMAASWVVAETRVGSRERAMWEARIAEVATEIDYDPLDGFRDKEAEDVVPALARPSDPRNN